MVWLESCAAPVAMCLLPWGCPLGTCRCRGVVPADREAPITARILPAAQMKSNCVLGACLELPLVSSSTLSQVWTVVQGWHKACWQKASPFGRWRANAGRRLFWAGQFGAPVAYSAQRWALWLPSLHARVPHLAWGWAMVPRRLSPLPEVVTWLLWDAALPEAGQWHPGGPWPAWGKGMAPARQSNGGRGCCPASASRTAPVGHPSGGRRR